MQLGRACMYVCMYVCMNHAREYTNMSSRERVCIHVCTCVRLLSATCVDVDVTLPPCCLGAWERKRDGRRMTGGV
jgi:hypothetical protein